VATRGGTLRREISNREFKISNEAKAKRKKRETCRPEGRRYRGSGKSAGETPAVRKARNKQGKQEQSKKP